MARTLKVADVLFPTADPRRRFNFSKGRRDHGDGNRITEPLTREARRNCCHLPGRVDRLEDLEEHLLKASRLARALWLSSCSAMRIFHPETIALASP